MLPSLFEEETLVHYQRERSDRARQSLDAEIKNQRAVRGAEHYELH